jgi:hypothetical protein
MLICMPVCHATLITYSVTNVANSTWRYDYSITNTTLTDAIDEFTIFFDRTLYTNLSVDNSPVDWDSIVIQPDLHLPDDGFFDSLALNGGVNPGATLNGYSVFFDWLGTGAPSSQAFTVVDPISFIQLDSGVTSLLVEPPTTSVPEPSTLTLLGIGLLLGLVSQRRKRLR